MITQYTAKIGRGRRDSFYSLTLRFNSQHLIHGVYLMNPKAERLGGGTVVFADKQAPITTDSLLLAEFCTVHPRWSMCDLGCGGGILLLSMIDKGLRGQAIGIDVNARALSLLQRSADEGDLENVEAIECDLRSYKPAAVLDLVVSNPPYFSSGMPSPNTARATARHELACTIDDIAAAAQRLLKDGGRFYLCYPPNRMAELFYALRTHRLEPKRIQFVRKSSQSEPWLLLLDARKAGGVGLTVLPDRLVEAGNPVHY